MVKKTDISPMLKSATFISDVHLGIQSPDVEKSKQNQLIQTIEQAAAETEALFLVGDIFDYWFEYKEVVPKGYTRFLGLLSRLSDSGFPITYFSGNHDFWLGSYFENECGLVTRYNELNIQIDGKQFEIAHGDGLGKGDYGYKFLKWMLQRKSLQWMYLKMHPNWGIGLARWASGTSRNYTEDKTDYGEKEFLFEYAKEVAVQKPIDYFICGHRHIPKIQRLNNRALYVNLGEWLFHRSYGVFKNGHIQIRQTDGTILFDELNFEQGL